MRLASTISTATSRSLMRWKRTRCFTSKELNGELKRAKDDRDVEHRRCREAVDAEQAAQKKIGQLEAEVHDRDMTIMELKAKLYDMMMKEGK